MRTLPGPPAASISSCCAWRCTGGGWATRWCTSRAPPISARWRGSLRALGHGVAEERLHRRRALHALVRHRRIAPFQSPHAPPAPGARRSRAAGARLRSWSRSARLAHPHAPDLRPLLQVLPEQAAHILGGKLVVQWLGIMIVHQDEAAADRQRLKPLEDELVALGRR